MNMTRVILGTISTLVLGATANLAVPADAQARSQAAWLGASLDGQQANCFVENRGGPVQRCTGGSWTIPIVYDNAGTKTIRVSAAGAGSGTRNVRCTAFSATAGGILLGGSMRQTVHNDGRTEMLQPSVHAHSFGGTWVNCQMDRDTRLFNVHY
jgi:hypothetical protein